MPNLRIFGSPIHDTSLVMIVVSSIASCLFYMFDGEVGQTQANLSLLFGVFCSFCYWYSQYKARK